MSELSSRLGTPVPARTHGSGTDYRQGGGGLFYGTQGAESFSLPEDVTVWYDPGTGLTDDVIPATTQARLWDTDQATTDADNNVLLDNLVAWWVLFTIPTSDLLYAAMIQDYPAIAGELAVIPLWDLFGRVWRRRQLLFAATLPLFFTLLAGDYVSEFGTSQDDFYGTTDNPALDYIDPDSAPLFAATPFDVIKTVSKQRVATSANGGPVLAIAPDGTLWATPTAGTVPGSSVGVPDFISALNSSFSDPLGVYTVANYIGAEGIAWGDGKWWLLLVEEQQLVSSAGGNTPVIDTRIKVFTSDVAIPAVASDWTEYRTIFPGYSSGGFCVLTPDLIWGYTGHLITSIGWDRTPFSESIPVRGTDGSLTLLSSISVPVSDIDPHTIGMNNDGTIVADGGDVNLHTFEVGSKGTSGFRSGLPDGNNNYYTISGTPASPGTLTNAGPVFTTTGGVLHFLAPETVPDYSVGTSPSVGGFYQGGLGPCGAGGYAIAIKSDDITDLTLFTGWDDPLGGYGCVISMGFPSSNSRVVRLFDASGTLQHSDSYTHGFEVIDPIGGCEGWQYAIVNVPAKFTATAFWQPLAEGRVSVWGIGDGGTVLRRVVYGAGWDGRTSNWSSLYVDYGASSTGTVGETTSNAGPFWNLVDGDQGFISLERINGYTDISFDGGNAPPVRMGQAVLFTNGSLGSNFTATNPLPGLVVGLCDDGSDGAYAILDDTNLYHLIEDPDNPGFVMVDGSAIATGVITSGDFVQGMRRRSTGQIIGVHGQSGACQTFSVVGATVTQGTPFSFPTDTINQFASHGSGAPELTTSFSSVIGF